MCLLDRISPRHVMLLVEVTSTLYFYGSQGSHADGKSTSMWGLHYFQRLKYCRKSSQQALCNALLAAASLEKLTSLFLVLFPSVILVGYTKLRSPAHNASAPYLGCLATNRRHRPSYALPVHRHRSLEKHRNVFFAASHTVWSTLRRKPIFLRTRFLGEISLKARPANEIEERCFNATNASS